MKFENFVEHLEKMEKSDGKIKLADLAGNLFKQSDADEIGSIIHMMNGELLPNFMGVEIGISAKSLLKVFSNIDTANQLYKQYGDLGLAIQQDIPETEGNHCSVSDVHESLLTLSDISGKGSQDKKTNVIRNLLEDVGGGKNSKWVMRVLAGKMRLGGSVGTIIRGLSNAFLSGSPSDKKIVEGAYYSCSDLGKTGRVACESGKLGLKKMELEPFKPVMPMLAGRARSVQEAAKKTDGTMHVEAKLDGERVQIHSDGTEVKIFSRSGEIITRCYPDVKEHMESKINHSFIIEGEAVAMDGDTMLPFQVLMHRKRETGIEKIVKECPVNVNLFDVLYLDGKSCINQGYLERKEMLQEAFQADEMLKHIDMINVENEDHLKQILDDALADGAEGLMIKSGNGKYIAGARANAWLKLKREYMEGEAETFDLAVVGALNGQGRRASTYGALVLGIKNGEKFSVIGKVGTGFTDKNLIEFKSLLGDKELAECPNNVTSNIKADVWFKPETIIEVSAFEITDSPTSEGGYGLRFPVYVRQRPDRDTSNASKVEDVAEAYNAQVKQIKK